MTKAQAPRKLVSFDATRYLNDDDGIAEYVTAVLETNDPDLLLLALGDVARAKGIAQVAKDAGLGRESLYKALAPGAKPRFG
jgi:probable addiction module antidote protein